MFTIKMLGEKDCPEAYAILSIVGKTMSEKKGLFHWWPTPVTLEWMIENLQKYLVYGVYQDKKMIATFTLQEEMADYYSPRLWKDVYAKSIYVRRLAILPEYQGLKIGDQIIQYIENTHLGRWVRLDTLFKNVSAVSFYKRLGYESRGICIVENKSGTWLCEVFEKFIKMPSKL